MTASGGMKQADGRQRRTRTEIRGSLISAARTHFSRTAYDRVSVREIAATAGAQASLVNRHFGSKEGLFREVLLSLALEHPADFPENSALLALPAPAYSSQTQESLDLLSIVVHSIGSPVAHKILAGDLEERFIAPLARRIQSDDANLRASLIFSVLIGVQLVRDLIQAQPLVNARQAEVFAIITPLLDQLRSPPAAPQV